MNKCSLKIFLFIFVIFLGSTLKAEDEFDPKFCWKITHSYAKARAPHRFNDNWTSSHIIFFDNGLYGVHREEWFSREDAEEYSKTKFKGKINILKDKEGFKIKHCSSEFTTSIGLSKDYHNPPKKAPRILSVKENVQRDYLKAPTYTYVIELNDGSVFITKPSYQPGQFWELGTRVQKLGNSKNACLVNLDDIPAFSAVNPENYLSDLERVK